MAKKRKAKPPKKHRAAPKAQSGAARLIFPPSPGTTGRFTAAPSSAFGPEPSSCVRELVQNGLDAALVSAKPKRDCAVVRFSLERCKLADIPGMAEYKTALAAACSEQQNDLTRGITDSLKKHSEKTDTAVLFVSDNGVGFDAPRLGAILGDGDSQQSGEESRGAFGNGHLTAFALSHLRYAFYGGVNKESGMMFSGHAILSSHVGKYNGKQCALGRDGYYVRGIKEDKTDFTRFDFPRKSNIPTLLRDKMDEIQAEWGNGSVVAIVGFNHFGGAQTKVAKTILRETALNFYVPVHNRKLRVEVMQDGETSILTRDNLREVLEENKDKTRGKNGFPSGQRIWNSYQTLVHGDMHNLKTTQGNIRLILRKDGDGKRVAICRNGMWITGAANMLLQADFGDREPFDALLMIDADTSGNAHTLVKLAETPLHNEIKKKSPSLTDDNKKKLQTLLCDLRDHIRGKTDEISGNQFSPSDIMGIEFAEESARGKKSKMPGNTEEIISGGRRPNENDKNKPHPKPPHPPNPNRPLRSGSAVNAKISSRRIGNSTLKAVFAPTANCEDVEMRLSLDGGEDITCAGREQRTITFSAVRIGGGKIPQAQYIKNDSGDIVGVRLGEWKTGERYEIEADYNPPAGNKLYALVIDLYRRKAQAGDKPEGDNVGD